MCHLIQISSTCIYGSGHTMDETTIPNPDTPYATAKLVAEKMLIRDLKKELLTIFRISNLYGKKQCKGIFPYLISSSKTEMKLQFNNNGLLLRYYINVDDCANYIMKLISLGYENLCGTFNLLGKEKYTIKDLVTLFEKIQNVQFKVHYADIIPYDNAIEILDEKINRIIPFESSNSVQSYLINS